MILTLWGLLFSISLVFLVIGYSFFERHSAADLCIIAGWFIVSILGFVMMLSGLSYETGEVESTVYSYSLVNESGIVRNLLQNSTMTKTPTYSTFTTTDTGILEAVTDSHLFGLLLFIVGLVGFSTFWFDRRKNGGDK